MTEANHILKNKLIQLIGQTILYGTIEHRINNFRIAEDSVYISTNVDLIVLGLADAESIITEAFFPVKIDKSNSSVQYPFALQQLNDSNILKTLNENIKKLQTDSGFIKQAMAINNTVNTVLNIVKVELQLKRVK